MIKKVKTTDYQELKKIWQSAVLATHEFLAQEDFLYYQENLLSYFEFVCLYGFYDDTKRLVGFIGIAQKNIEMLFVDQQYFGQGIGKALIHYAIEKHQVEFVDVNEQNQGAVEFYRHLGFECYQRNELDDSGRAYPILKLRLQ